MQFRRYCLPHDQIDVVSLRIRVADVRCDDPVTAAAARAQYESAEAVRQRGGDDALALCQLQHRAVHRLPCIRDDHTAIDGLTRRRCRRDREATREHDDARYAHGPFSGSTGLGYRAAPRLVQITTTPQVTSKPPNSVGIS